MHSRNRPVELSVDNKECGMRVFRRTSMPSVGMRVMIWRERQNQKMKPRIILAVE